MNLIKILLTCIRSVFLLFYLCLHKCVYSSPRVKNLFWSQHPPPHTLVNVCFSYSFCGELLSPVDTVFRWLQVGLIPLASAFRIGCAEVFPVRFETAVVFVLCSI